eukprot:360034-Chlamydomonas_euryale.AAC.1
MAFGRHTEVGGHVWCGCVDIRDSLGAFNSIFERGMWTGVIGCPCAFHDHGRHTEACRSMTAVNACVNAHVDGRHYALTTGMAVWRATPVLRHGV